MPHDEWNFPGGRWGSEDDIPAGTPLIVQEAFSARQEGRSWTAIGRDLGLHRSTAQRWATGNRDLPSEEKYISMGETRRLSQTATRAYNRRAARGQLNDFKPGSRWAYRRWVGRSFQKDGKRYTYRQRLGRGQSAEQERRMRALGPEFEEHYRERYPRWGGVDG